MAHVLVTGGNGFIGRHLVEALLARGDEVTCLVRTSSQVDALKDLNLRLSVGDVCHPDTLPPAVAAAEIVYHLAGLTKANRRDEYDRVNRDGVEHLLAACASRSAPPVFVLLSSLSAAGPSSVDRPRVETDPVHPVSHYGQSKRAGELAAESWAHAVPATVVRPPVVIGQRDRMSLGLFRAIRRLRMFTVLGRGRQISIVHVSDLVAAMIAAAERGERLPARDSASDSATNSNSAGQGYYFVAADEQLWFPELSRIVALAVGRPRAFKLRLPEAVLWTVGAGGEVVGRLTGRAPYLNWDRAREITAGHWTCSAEKARRQLSFRPAASLAQRVDETAAWYRKQGWL